VKILGWERQADGQEFWLIENSWGSDWGENGYARILASDKSTQLDFYAIGVAAYPYTMAEYYAMQEEMQKRGSQQGGDIISEQEIDLDTSAGSDDSASADQ
jgi:cathepsin B